MNETLYRKVGRKYVPVSDRWDGSDQMKVGTFRLTYCYRDGGRRYEYNVTPDTASWVAAALLAKHAMEEAIRAAADAKPRSLTTFTRKQLAILKRFRKEMSEAGGLLPHWWEHSSVYEISEAAVQAVKEYRP